MKSSQSKSPEEGTFDCGLCGQSIAIDVRAVGTEVSCPYCEGDIIVPGFAKSDDSGSGSGDKTTGDHPVQKDSGGLSASPGVTLPSPRKEGESPKVSALADEPGELPSYRFTRALPSPVDGVAMVSAISRGEAGILKSRKIGSRHVAFGCPFCAKPIKIKLRQQGKHLQCAECSGTMIAPDHDSGVEAQPVSGQGGIAGGQNVDLPRVKTRSLQAGRPERNSPEPSPGQGGITNERSTGGVSSAQGAIGDQQTVRHRLNDDLEVRLVPRDEVEAGKGMEDQWDEQSMGKSSGIGLKRLRFLALMIMAGSMVFIVIISLKRSNIMEKEAAFPGHAQDKEPRGRPAVQKAISLSSEFSLLSTVNRRLKYVRHPDVSQSRMQKYYAGVFNNTVFPPLDVRSYQETEIKGIRFARMTSIVEPGKRQREFFFELSDDGGILLDWESAVGYCDVDAMEYSSDPVNGSVQMRVMVKPAEYYAFKFADADAFDCYEITDLTSRIRIHGYVERGTADAESLRSLHPGGGDGSKGFVYCTLVLRSGDDTESRGARQVRIERFVKDSWLLP